MEYDMTRQNTTLFDTVVRSDSRIIQCGESEYEYINRSAIKEAERVRVFIEALATQYKCMHGVKAFRQVAALFRSRENGQHSAGHFELVMNRLLGCDGCTVRAVEPTLPNGTKPDFLVEGPNGQAFYVEAQVVTRVSDIGWLGRGDGLPKEVHAEQPIRSRIIDEKMIRYGDPGKPFVVAVNSLDRAADRVTFEDILLGSYGVKSTLAADGNSTFDVVRGLEDGTDDGVLALNACKNVSAFLFVRCCKPGIEPNATYCLYHNPRARWPLHCALPSFYRALYRRRPGSGRWYWRYRDGIHLGDLLGLSPDWPHDVINDKLYRRLKLLEG